MRLSAPIFKLKQEAKQTARNHGIALHMAQDKIAIREGFNSWSHLSASTNTKAQDRPAIQILSKLSPGMMLLLGARPGHGKTRLGLELAAKAASAGQPAYFFTLDYNEPDIEWHFDQLGLNRPAKLVIDTSDNICASHVIERLAQANEPALAVIDYMQLLDQRRRTPELGEQLQALSAMSRASGAIIVLISQIDRRFEMSGASMPGLSDVRLPNPADLSLFDMACFLHDGALSFQDAA